MTKLTENAELVRASGNSARDRREWLQASLLYQQYLAAQPKDAGIWVQLGHALKESSRFQEAEAAYRSALALTPDDADLHLQIGHLLKLTGRTEQAIKSYAASLRLSPTMAAYNELTARGQGRLVLDILSIRPNLPSPSLTYVQVTDFFNYLRAHKTVSGIQRVQLGIIMHVLAMPLAAPELRRIVYTEGRSPQLWALQPDKLAAVADYVGGAHVDHGVLRSLIATAIDAAEAVKLRPGDTCVIAGSFWGTDTAIDLLRECNKQGVYTAIYFYDLLPVTHPEFFDSNLANTFRQSLFQTLLLLDFALCISKFTTRELQRFIAENGLRPMPAQAVTLAHAFKDVLPVGVEDADDKPWPSAIAALRNRSFVLCICTIEIRKNHRYLFDAWKALIADGEEMPDLVLVGRPGWRVNDLMAQLDTTRYLHGRIHVVHDLSDAELATLYRHCSFTVFPSFAEGWGLPIGESLSYGKLCIASNTTSMPEVGGDLVEYIDPMNLRSGIETLRRVVRDPKWVAEREAAIRDSFQPKLWDQVGADFIASIDRLRQDVGAKQIRSIVPELDAGQALSFSSNDYDPLDRTQQLLRLALVGHWFSREDIGVWMEGHSAGIEFGTGLLPNEPVVVLLRLNIVPWATENTLTIADTAGKTVSVHLAAGRSMVSRIKTNTGENGRVALALTISGQVRAHGMDTRPICIGLARLGFAAQADGGSRLHLLEQILARTTRPPLR